MKLHSLLVAGVFLLGRRESHPLKANRHKSAKMRLLNFRTRPRTSPPSQRFPKLPTDTPGVPSPQTTGEAPNVSKKMGAEMDSAGDPKASPDRE
jgi:hypothetical protein